MTKLFTLLFFLFTALVGLAQEFTSPDLRQVTITGGKTPAQTAVNIGRQFLGAPYVPRTLDADPTEKLVVNVRAFDCTTYIETVLALALAHHRVASGNALPFEAAFRSYLTLLRYRAGRIDGYASRLHYFSDWLRDNERKGLLADVTGELPGSMSVAKSVSYMTRAVYKYPHLSDPTTLKQMLLTEAALNQRSFSFIPKKNIRLAEAQLREGDIVMLTAAQPGLDMKHVGLAVRQPSGRIHLLHASSDQRKVVITRYPLSNYLLYHKHLSGIRVARLRGGGMLTAGK
ncbi:N-acetylmuramoyl-L-alanine amidase-like domain-containing protein [Spirosoma arcticum]